MSKRLSLRIHGALLVVQVFFASLSVFGKEALQYIGWPALVTIRVGVSMVLFFALARLSGYQKIASKDHRKLALYGLLGVAANQIQFLAGLARTKAIHATVLVTSIPVFATIIAVFWGRESLTLKKSFGIFLALLGALILILSGVEVSESLLSFSSGQAFGNLLILSNSFCYAMFLVISKDLLTKYSSSTVVFWMFFYGFLEVLAFDFSVALLFPEEAYASWMGVLNAPWHLAWIPVSLVIVVTIVGYGLNSWALKAAPSSLVAIYVYLQPLLTACLAYVRLGEKLTLYDLLAAVLIIIGVSFVGRAAPRPKEQKQTPIS